MLMGIALTSCVPSSDTIDETTPESTTEGYVTTPAESLPAETTPPPEQEMGEPKDAQIITNLYTDYTVMRPEGANSIVTNAAEIFKGKFRSLIQNPDGVYISEDFVTEGQKISPDEKVILIGYTNRAESRLVYEGLKFGDYKVANVNGKIVIAAYTSKAFTAAITDFIQYIKDHSTSQAAIIPKDFVLSGSAVETRLSTIPAVPGTGNVYIHDMGDQCYMAVTDDTTPEIFESYKVLLTENGFTEYATNKIDENLFATYTNQTLIVNTYYSAFSKEIRVTAEPKSETSLPTRAEDNNYTAVTTPLVTQIGLERVGNSGYQNGMSYVFRLADGSFIIYDGGFSQNAVDAKKLHQVLVEQAPDKDNITIAAWIITHAHGDHFGTFYHFFSEYKPNSEKSKYTIETVIRNYPSSSDASGAGNVVQQTPIAVETRLKATGTNLVKSHPGQVFHIRDAKITVMYNLEMYLPNSFTYFNASSTVTKIELAGQSFMMLGDCTELAAKILVQTYSPESLASDFLQVAHHGYMGGTTALYRAIDPTYVLWPMGTADYAIYKAHERSAFLFSSTKIKQIFVAGHTKYEFSLPFNGGNYKKTVYPS